MKWLILACLLVAPVAAEEDPWRDLHKHLTPEQMSRVRRTHSLELTSAEREQGQAILDHILARQKLEMKEAPRLDLERWLTPDQVDVLRRMEQLERDL